MDHHCLGDRAEPGARLGRIHWNSRMRASLMARSLRPGSRKDSKLLGGEILFVTFDIEGNHRLAMTARCYTAWALKCSTRRESYRVQGRPARNRRVRGARRRSHTGVYARPRGPRTTRGRIRGQLVTLSRTGATDKSESFSKQFQVLPRKFGLVQVGMTYFVPGRRCPTPRHSGSELSDSDSSSTSASSDSTSINPARTSPTSGERVDARAR